MSRNRVSVRIGSRINNWKFLKDLGTRPLNNSFGAFFLCQCKCGNKREMPLSWIKSGNSKSCGCIKLKSAGHRLHKGNLASRTYTSWRSMHARCRDSKLPGWKHYGGRGIKVCKRWSGEYGFRNFLKDLGPRPKDRTLDRIDNNKGYYPFNCRWATAKQQRANKRAIFKGRN